MIYLTGEIHPAPDKSISHRALMISSIAEGKTTIKNFLRSDDCLSTLKCLQALGVEIEDAGGKEIIVHGKGKFLSPPASGAPLYAGNSGTTARLLSGILAGQNFKTTLTGDASLSSRPMNRIARPLEMMGATVKTTDGKLPLEISGGRLKAIDYDSPVASAQVKSCILLAALYADGKTTFREPQISRDHTERMLSNFGVRLTSSVTDNHGPSAGTRYSVSLTGPVKKLVSPGEILVPADISSAAFFLVAGATIPGSRIKLKNVGLNPTRTGILSVLKRMGAAIKISIPDGKNHPDSEPSGDITVSYSHGLRAVTIDKDEIPLLIDELPVIAVAATQAAGETIVKGASELRVKETDRIKSIVNELSKIGAEIKEFPDGFSVKGPVKLSHKRNQAPLESYGDHRMAMSLAVALLIAGGEDNFQDIKNYECASVSYPDFYKTLKSLIKK